MIKGEKPNPTFEGWDTFSDFNRSQSWRCIVVYVVRGIDSSIRSFVATVPPYSIDPHPVGLVDQSCHSHLYLHPPNVHLGAVVANCIWSERELPIYEDTN